MKKTLTSLSMLAVATLASFPAFAATETITKTSTAPVIRTYSNGASFTEFTFFNILSSDFKNGTINKAKKLQQVKYSLASYPSAYTENAELCYYRPNNSGPAKCIGVTPGSSGSTTEFNNIAFDLNAKIRVHRTLTGEPNQQLNPSRQESLTIEFSY